MVYMFGKKLGGKSGMRWFLLALAIASQPLTGWVQEAVNHPGASAGRGARAEKQATFRSGVDLVTISATVRDGKEIGRASCRERG